MKANNFRPARTREAGFSAIDLMITVMIVALVATLAIARMSVAQEWLRLSRSAQVLSAYADKARLSAVRCHCTTTIQITSTGSFTVTGPLKSATSETLTFPLDKDVTFQGLTLPLTISFDYRGRPDNDYHLTLSNARGSRTVDLSGGGDVKIDSTSDYTYAPTIQANMPTDLSDGAADSYVTSFANNNSNSNTAPPVNPKNHKKPKK